MPQASEELREKIRNRFGSIDDQPVAEWLRERGWTLLDNWRWSPPLDIPKAAAIPDDQSDAIHFLITEWDYGGIIAEPHFW